jgi:hypothetical protein
MCTARSRLKQMRCWEITAEIQSGGHKKQVGHSEEPGRDWEESSEWGRNVHGMADVKKGPSEITARGTTRS